MTLRYTVLASGSGGNASLVQTDGFGVLLDCGMGPKELGNRLREAGHNLNSVQAMLLTHTHSDHWNDRILSWLARKHLPLFCHPSHHDVLGRYSRGFDKLVAANLVRAFSPGEELLVAPGLRCRALPVSHDGGETFGFRIDGPPDLFGRAAALGHLSDLGTWDEELADALADIDLLAIEFNHDVELERRSQRPAFLIARVLGDEGHLSNEQAAALVRAVVRRSTPGRLQHVVQLHLSGDCNRPTLARRAARNAIDDLDYPVRIHTGEQHRPGKVLCLEPGHDRRRRVRKKEEAWLPGLEPEPGATER
jgi:phosphoribosyl 1,2-cyclic phosphodiesterase